MSKSAGVPQFAWAVEPMFTPNAEAVIHDSPNLEPSIRCRRRDLVDRSMGSAVLNLLLGVQKGASVRNRCSVRTLSPDCRFSKSGRSLLQNQDKVKT